MSQSRIPSGLHSSQNNSAADGKYVLKAYPLNSEFIGTLRIEENKSGYVTGTKYQTIIIMDQSGSMGSQAQRLVQQIFPLFFSKLQYRGSNTIYLIAFESVTQLYTVTVDQVSSLPIVATGGTNMNPAVEKCREVFQLLNSDEPVRLLTISDGEVYDQAQTATSAADLASYLSARSFRINSKAVRLFTSSSQPDTTALCSLLQLNNSTSCNLIDVDSNESDDSIATKIANLFMMDNFANTHLLTTTSNVIYQSPADKTLTPKTTLVPGRNVFHLTRLPSQGFKVDGVTAKTEIQPPTTLNQFRILMQSRGDIITEQVKTLKALNTQASLQAIDRMNKYMIENEKALTAKAPKASSSSSTTPMLSMTIREIVKDDTVRNMSSAEKALYLTSTSKQGSNRR